MGSPFPRELLGAAQHPISPGVIAQVTPARVPHMRVDAYFDRAVPAEGVYDWSEMDARVGAMRASGAEPLLVLAYVPPWLSACADQPAIDRLPPIGHVEWRFCPPSDLAKWRAVVRDGAAYAATRWGVREFEGWNEPDNPGFWRGTLADYLALYEATAAGVADASRLTGEDLRLGGPATLFANPAWIPPFLAFAAARSLPVDFVSYHWYADYPFLGPIDPLPGTVVTDNPAMLTRHFRDHAAIVRSWADAAGFGDADVWLDEWNLNAGDAPRMRGPFGAPFVAAAFREMTRDGGPDKASFFNVEHDVWGLFGTDGRPRPSWLAFRALLSLGDVLLPVDREASSAPGVDAVAARDERGAIKALVYNVHGQVGADARVRLAFDGLAHARFALRDLDGTVLASGVAHCAIDFDLPDRGVRVVELSAA